MHVYACKTLKWLSIFCLDEVGKLKIFSRAADITADITADIAADITNDNRNWLLRRHFRLHARRRQMRFVRL